MQFNNNQQVYFALVKAGLWEKEARLASFSEVDYSEVQRIAEEQTVVGLATAGLEHVVDVRVPKEDLLQFIGQSLQLEQSNKSMNEYLAWLIDRLCKEDVYAILVKGQGIAQCYERPNWRSSGDIDLLLSDVNYNRAKEILIPIAVSIEEEFKSLKHLAMTMQGGIVVELHGTLHSHLSKRVDNVVDEVQRDIFYGGNVRSWVNGKTTVFLPSPDNDVFFVFTHILKHFFFEGIGLRQVCDWCRLIWTYRDKLDIQLLECRLRKAGLMSEWKAFATVAVLWLGFPKDQMPLYDSHKKWGQKAFRIVGFIMESGNLGHNNSRRASTTYLTNKVLSAWYKAKIFGRHIRVFPLDSVRFFLYFCGVGIRNVINRE